MSTLGVVRSEALQLSPVERESLVQDLILSLGSDPVELPPSVDPEYEQELTRRVQSIEQGTARLSDGQAFIAEVRSWGRKSETP